MKSDSHRHITRLLSIVVAILIASGALLLNTARPLYAEGEGFTLSTTTLSVSETGTGTFTAVLDVQPAGGSWSGTTGTLTTADAMTGGDPGGGMSWIRLPTGDLMRFSIGGNDTFWLYAYLNGFQTGRLTSSGNCGCLLYTSPSPRDS